MSAPIGKYRAKDDCRAGGMFRRAGDVFEMPLLKDVPGHLEEIGAQGSGNADMGAAPDAKPRPGRPAAVPRAARVGKADIGAGTATPVQNVTSADMITK